MGDIPSSLNLNRVGDGDGNGDGNGTKKKGNEFIMIVNNKWVN